MPPLSKGGGPRSGGGIVKGRQNVTYVPLPTEKSKIEIKNAFDSVESNAFFLTYYAEALAHNVAGVGDDGEGGGVDFL